MGRVRLDLNNGGFQEQWFALARENAMAVFKALQKISNLDWEQLYQDRGLRWEAIHSRTGPHKQRLYSFRVTQRVRAVAYRDDDVLRLLSLHADHDSAY